jgi:hypothetical protein
MLALQAASLASCKICIIKLDIIFLTFTTRDAPDTVFVGYLAGPDFRIIKKPDTVYPAGIKTTFLVKYQINL